MKIVEMTSFLKFILPKDVIGITLAPFGIYFRNIDAVDEISINHEKIHWKQQLEMLIIFFYFIVSVRIFG